MAAVAARRKSEPRARAAVVPFPAGSSIGARLGRLLPSGRAVVAGLAMLSLGAGAYVTARVTPLFAVERIEVRGASPGVAAGIRAALEAFSGDSLVGLDGDAVLRSAEAVPEVASVTYDRAFPHTLVVRVEAERPVAVLRSGARSWLLSASARVLRPLRRGARPSLPRIWLSESVALEPGARLGSPEARRAARALAGLAGSGLTVRVRTVRADDGELTLVLVSGLELRLGDEREVELKLAVARRILPLLPRPVATEHAYLDVSVPERPVAGPTLNSQVELEG